MPLARSTIPCADRQTVVYNRLPSTSWGACKAPSCCAAKHPAPSSSTTAIPSNPPPACHHKLALTPNLAAVTQTPHADIPNCRDHNTSPCCSPSLSTLSNTCTNRPHHLNHTSNLQGHGSPSSPVIALLGTTSGRYLTECAVVGGLYAATAAVALAAEGGADVTAAAAAAAAGVVDAATAAELAAAGVSSTVPLGYVPSPLEPGWEIWAGFVAGVVPFIIGAYEFGKRIIIQLRCEICGGRGLVASAGAGRDKYLRKCPQCGGFFPWISWKMFLSSTAAPGNGGPLRQPRGQTSVFYSVPDAPDPAKQEAARQRSQAAIDAQSRSTRGRGGDKDDSQGAAEGGAERPDTAVGGTGAQEPTPQQQQQ